MVFLKGATPDTLDLINFKEQEKKKGETKLRGQNSKLEEFKEKDETSKTKPKVRGQSSHLAPNRDLGKGF